MSQAATANMRRVMELVQEGIALSERQDAIVAEGRRNMARMDEIARELKALDPRRPPHPGFQGHLI